MLAPALRILHGFEEVAGQVEGMAEAQRLLGVDALAVIFRPHPFGYDNKSARSSISSHRLQALSRAFRHSDIVHLYFGSSLFTINRLPDYPVSGPFAWTRRAVSRLVWMRDLPLLKALGKTVAMTFLGDDVRQVDWTRAQGRISHLDGDHGDVLAAFDKRKRRLTALADRYADLIYATNPDLIEVLPAKTQFLPYVVNVPSGYPVKGDRLTVAHAPSHLGVKGTAIVQDAMERVRLSDPYVNFDLIHGVEHAQVLNRVSRADIFIDQLRVGWYGVAAVEALSRGCITLAHIDDGDFARIPIEMRQTLPIIRVRNADDIATAIQNIAAMPDEKRLALSRNSMTWAERWHGSHRVAAGILDDYLRICTSHDNKLLNQ